MFVFLVRSHAICKDSGLNAHFGNTVEGVITPHSDKTFMVDFSSLLILPLLLSFTKFKVKLVHAK